jgi:putative endonuclease
VLNYLWKTLDTLRHAARIRRWHPFHAFGRRGEDLAHRLLRSEGYTVVARNYRTNTGSGEVDIIAWQGETLVFVEVKSRRTDEFGPPESAIDLDKRTRLVRAAGNYALRANISWDKVRFDVVTIVSGKPPEVRLFQDAFRTHTSVS